MQRPASTCRSPTRRPGRASRRGAAPGRRRRRRAAVVPGRRRQRADQGSAQRELLARPRTSSSGSATGDHRLQLHRPGGRSSWMQAVLRAGVDRPQRLSPTRAVGLRRTRSGARRGSPAGGGRGRAASRGSIAARRARPSKSGTERSSPSVYGCRGERKVSSTLPVSTIWPAYMTASRWQVWVTTARSWVTKTSERRARSRSALEQLEHLNLDRHVERGRRLVAEDQLRLAGQGDRDHDPLAHAAGELVRVGARAARRVGDARPGASGRAARSPRLPTCCMPQVRPAGPRRSGRPPASPGSARSSAPGRSSRSPGRADPAASSPAW